MILDKQNIKQNELEDKLVHTLDLNGGIRIEVADFFGKMHAENYLNQESSLEKPLVEERKMLFVKLKVEGYCSSMAEES